MHLVNIALALVIILGVCASVRGFSKILLDLTGSAPEVRVEKRLRYGNDYIAFHKREWVDSYERHARWERKHPDGPITDADEHERNDLLLEEMGAYMIYKDAEGKAFFDEYSERICNCTKDRLT